MVRSLCNCRFYWRNKDSWSAYDAFHDQGTSDNLPSWSKLTQVAYIHVLIAHTKHNTNVPISVSEGWTSMFHVWNSTRQGCDTIPPCVVNPDLFLSHCFTSHLWPQGCVWHHYLKCQKHKSFCSSVSNRGQQWWNTSDRLRHLKISDI